MVGYSLDLRERIVEAVREGTSQAQVAGHFRVSRATVERYWRLAREGRALAALPNRGSPPLRVPPEQHAWLLAQLVDQPDWTLAEHAEA